MSLGIVGMPMDSRMNSHLDTANSCAEKSPSDLAFVPWLFLKQLLMQRQSGSNENVMNSIEAWSIRARYSIRWSYQNRVYHLTTSGAIQIPIK